MPTLHPGSSRRALRAGLLVVLLVVGVEAVSYLAYWFAAGQRFSFARAGRQRQRLLTRPVADREEAGMTSKGEVIPASMYRFAEVHPYLGFSYDPESRLRRLRGEAPASAWGFADWANRSPVRRRGPGKVVVGILGASVASLLASQGLQTLEGELSQTPRFAGREIEFVSLAVGGFKQPQQLMALNYALSLGAEFDLIVNLDGLNEVAWYRDDSWRNGVFHLYPNGWHRFLALLPDPTTEPLAAQRIWLTERRARWARSFQASRLRFSVTVNLIWKLGDRRAARREAVARKALLRKVCGEPRHAAQGPPHTFRDDDEMLAELVATWERCSLLLDRLCREHGIAYYHFLQPNQYVPGSKPLSDLEKKKAVLKDLPGKSFIEKGYPLMRQAGQRLARQGVRFHDLSMAYADNPNTLYFDDCCHINRAGAEALAEPIAQALGQTGEPPRATEVRVSRGRPPVRR